MGALDHDCPGCLFKFIENITVTQHETGSEIVAWSAEVTKGTQMVELVFAKKDGEITALIDMQRPTH